MVLVKLSCILCLLTVTFRIGYGAPCETSLNKTDKFDAKITKGRLAKEDEFTFLARIIYKLATYCAGSLLNAKWVLTAAFCIPNADFPGDIMVEVYRKNIEVPGGESIQGKSIQVHPKYEKDVFSMYDIALLELVHPVKDPKEFLELSPEPWPTSGEDEYNRNCLVAGFGATQFGRTTSKTLLVTSLSMRHGRYGCRCHNDQENKRVLCSNDKEQGLCSEDNGAPLICDKKGYGVAHLSYQVEQCNPLRVEELTNNCKSKISAFMFLCPELEWISSIVQDSRIPEPPSSCKASQNSIFILHILSIKFFIIYVFFLSSLFCVFSTCCIFRMYLIFFITVSHHDEYN